MKKHYITDPDTGKKVEVINAAVIEAKESYIEVLHLKNGGFQIHGHEIGNEKEGVDIGFTRVSMCRIITMLFAIDPTLLNESEHIDSLNNEDVKVSIMHQPEVKELEKPKSN